jgi:hypothetical protein
MPLDKNEPEQEVQAAVKEKDSSMERAPEELSASLWQAKPDTAKAPESTKNSQAPSLEIVDERGAKTPIDTGNTAAKASTEAAEQKLTPRKLIDKAEKEPKPEELREANTALFKAATEAENKSIWKLPTYIRGLPQSSPELGCVSSFSDRFRRAMEIEGSISNPRDASHRKYYQVNMDDLIGVMSADNLLKRIDPSEVREGDIIVGKSPNSTSRHMGIVGRDEKGVQQTYHNNGGKWIKQSAQTRFYDRYPQVEYYRAYLPPKKST